MNFDSIHKDATGGNVGLLQQSAHTLFECFSGYTIGGSTDGSGGF